MSVLLARFFRWLLRFPLLRGQFYALYKNLFKPYRLFDSVQETLRVGPLNMQLDLSDWIPQNLYFTGTYEAAELEAILSLISQGDTVIDLGANIGWYSLQMAQRVGETGAVYSFEPYSQNFATLLKNIALNPGSKIAPEQIAISDTEGQLKLYLNKEEQNLGMVTADSSEGEYLEETQMSTLDEVVKKHDIGPIDFIKIDIEGHEQAALRGMQSTLERDQPVLLIEILPSAGNDSPSPGISQQLTSLGYTKCYITDQGTLSDTETNPERHNYLFIPNTRNAQV